MSSRNSLRKFGIVLSLAVVPCSAHGADTKAAEIVTRHLDSIGTAEARAAIKSRTIQGALHMKSFQGKAGESTGRGAELQRPDYVMKFAGGRWEQFVFDAGKVPKRQPIPTPKLLLGEDFIVKEGLLGGELSPAWALQNLAENRVKLNYTGLKKVDGRELHCVEYHSKGNGDVTVKLYFDRDTYHHVKSIYSVSMPPGIRSGGMPRMSQHEIHSYEEQFSDFRTDNGITLPWHYDLKYTEELHIEKAMTSETLEVIDWDLTAEKILNNPEADTANSPIK